MVDDQPAKLLSHEVILAELGENLIKANSAREALNAPAEERDRRRADGREHAGASMVSNWRDMIRQHPRFQKTAIIFISAVHLTDLDQLKGYAARSRGLHFRARRSGIVAGQGQRFC